MSATLAALRKHLTGLDAVLVIAGVMGLVAYFELLPAQHPDSAASFELSEGEVIERAEAFAEQSGFSLSDEEARVSLRRNETLLDSLQRALGRPQAVRLLKSEARERLPAYHWSVAWEQEGEDENETVEVLLTVGGAAYSFRPGNAEATERTDQTVDREALTYTLEAGRAEPAAPPLAEMPDSVLIRRARTLTFDLTHPDSVAEGDEQEVVAETSAWQPLHEEATVRLARYHLGRTALDGYRFQVDSVWTAQQAGAETATVRFWGDAFHGQHPRVDVKVTAAGALLALEPEFNPEGVRSPSDAAEQPAGSQEAGEGAADDVSIEISGETAAEIVSGVLYVLLALVSFFLFFRRMQARLVDMSAALRDALWGGFFAAVALSLPVAGSMLQEGPGEFWMAIVAVGMTAAFAGAGGAFLIFVASGAMNSVARAIWPEKLTTLSLVRHGALRNVPVGAALLRGFACAGVLLGGTTVLLMLFPQAALSALDVELGRSPFVSTFAYSFAGSSWVSLFLNLTAILGVGTLLRRWKMPPWIGMLGLALLLMLLQVGLVSLSPVGYQVLTAGFAGLVLAFAFWRFDFIASFMAFLLAHVLWWISNGWMVEGSPEGLDALLAFVTVGFIGVLAWVGLLSGRTSTEVPTYVPSYIKELAEEERLKRDIEIAQQVQQSFLPRRMPQVEGLDLAAMCLAAQEVGGDYYDFIEIAPRKLAVAIGDVSGKGIQAAFFMTLVKGLLQTLAREERSPAEVLRRLNTLFCANVPRGTFVSMIYGVIDVEAGTFTFARAGHNPLIYRRSPNETPRFLQPGGMAIGLTPDARFDAAIEEKTLTLREGDTLVLYTDGVPEAVNAHGEAFGDERLVRTVEAAGARSAREVLRTVSENVHQYVEAAGRHDDMTMVVVKMSRQIARRAPAEAPAEQATAEV